MVNRRGRVEKNVFGNDFHKELKSIVYRQYQV